MSSCVFRYITLLHQNWPTLFAHYGSTLKNHFAVQSSTAVIGAGDSSANRRRLALRTTGLAATLTRHRLNILSKNPVGGGGGGWSSMRSGVGPPSAENWFSSLKHSVSSICGENRARHESYRFPLFRLFYGRTRQSLRICKK